MSFLQFRLIDVVDIFLVAFIMYKIYNMVKGTIALNILLGLFGFVIFWVLIKALNMDLTGSILDNFVNVGVLAVIIVFQQEIRRFFLRFGLRYNWLYTSHGKLSKEYIDPIIKACENFSKSNTGALIVITGQARLKEFTDSGEKLNSRISYRLIESIFFKNSPLHDGAIIISNDTVDAAACILPVSQNPDLPKHMGLRHRAAMGITEATDAAAVVVSEETGEISFFRDGKFLSGINPNDLLKQLKKL